MSPTNPIAYLLARLQAALAETVVLDVRAGRTEAAHAAAEAYRQAGQK